MKLGIFQMSDTLRKISEHGPLSFQDSKFSFPTFAELLLEKWFPAL